MPYFVEPNEPLDLVSPDNPLIMRTGVNKGNVTPTRVTLQLGYFMYDSTEGDLVSGQDSAMSVPISTHDLIVVCDTYPPVVNTGGPAVTTARVVGYIDIASGSIPVAPPAFTGLYHRISGAVAIEDFNPGCTAQGSFNIAIEFYKANTQPPVFAYGGGTLTTSSKDDLMFTGENLTGIRFDIALPMLSLDDITKYCNNLYRLWFY